MRTLIILLTLVLTSCLDQAQVQSQGGAYVPSCMPTTLSPAAAPTFPASLTAPADGDACNAASNNGPDQKLLDGVEAARLMLYRGLSIKPRLRSINGTSVVMTGVPAMAVTASGVWTIKGPIASQTFVVGDLEGGGVFAASTFYYMYLYLSGGTVTRQISTTAPDAYNRYKSTSTDYAYVGSFITSATPLIFAFSAENGVYHIHQAPGLSLWTDISGVTMATTYTLSTTPKAVPASSQKVLVQLSGSGTADNTDIGLYFGPADGTNADGWKVGPKSLQRRVTDGDGTAGTPITTSQEFAIALDATQRFILVGSAAAYSAALYYVGYVEH